MAYSSSSSSSPPPLFSLLNLKQVFIASFLIVVTIISSISRVHGCFTSIISFGDSITDTGNIVQIELISGATKLHNTAFPPYGRTFFHHPTGRASDGRLIIDFIAEEFGFPYLPPYFGGEDIDRSKKFEKGVNFAVSGATALDDEVLKERGIINPTTNVSLGIELGFFKDVLHSLCSSLSDCKNLLGSSLIVMGEIGGNDYNFPLWKKKNIEETRQLVPLVIDTIASAINELIELGAVTFLVPGNFPIGCSPSYLTVFQGTNKTDYDHYGCIPWLNQFSEYHNKMLQRRLDRIRQLHPHVNIVYADYYTATMRLYRSPEQFGFTKGTLKACCGSGGPYNYNQSMKCGYLPVRSCCNDPSSYISWDGIHYTEATYKWISKTILEGLYANVPSLSNLCPLIEKDKVGSS